MAMVLTTMVMFSALLPTPGAAVPSSDGALGSSAGAESVNDVSHINDFIREDNGGDLSEVADGVKVVVPENKLFEGGSLESAVMDEKQNRQLGEGGSKTAWGRCGSSLAECRRGIWFARSSTS